VFKGKMMLCFQLS